MPSEKRARQRASRNARVVQLQRRQQRRRTNRRAIIAGAIVVVFLAIAFFTTRSSPKANPLAAIEAGLVTRTPPAHSAACNTKAVATTGPTTTVPAKGNAVAIVDAPAVVPFPKLTGSSPHYTKFSSPPPFCLDVNKIYTATMKTDVGTITIELLPKYAPIAVNNFVFLAGYHYFDGTVFHRVIPGFVDQGGDPLGTGTGGPGYKFKDELPKSKAAYGNGSLAMANSGVNTNGSQFFLVVNGGGSQLTTAYSAYGGITAGLSVADKINSDGTSAGTPKVLHKILSVTIAES